MKKPREPALGAGPKLGAGPATGGLPHLDVDGAVERDGARALRVTVAGKVHEFDAAGRVTVAGRRYLLMRLGDRDALVLEV